MKAPRLFGFRYWATLAVAAFLVLAALVVVHLSAQPAEITPVSAVQESPSYASRYYLDTDQLTNLPFEPLTGKFVVAIQTGHWQVADLPDELRRLRGSVGASTTTSTGKVTEVDINRTVAKLLMNGLKARGYEVLDVPATVPAQLRADAFVSIHADWSSNPKRKGWKLSPPWRSSQRSKELARAIANEFTKAKALSHDGVDVSMDTRGYYGNATVAMRGYFGFNFRRFEHSISPFTPAVLVEMGFITNPADRIRLLVKPQLYATLLERGIVKFLRSAVRSMEAAYRPQIFSWQKTGSAGAEVRREPDMRLDVVQMLAPDVVVMPVDYQDNWYEIFMRSTQSTGWVLAEDLEPTDDPHWPMPGETSVEPGDVSGD